MMPTVDDTILFNQGHITLNRPKALNSLTTEMCQVLRQQLQAWEKDAAVANVIIDGMGDRAFCAGGDIRALYQNGRENPEQAINFFRQEYRMNKTIFHYAKPYIAFLHGITMGGGVGVSLHGSHRVASEDLVLAMPETGIGFFPDVGGSYFLSRLKSKMGYYLGLTGERIGAADAKWLGLITHIIPKEKKSVAMEAIKNQTDKDKISSILDQFCIEVSSARLINRQNQIEDCFSADSVEEIFLRLEENNTEWSLLTTKTLLSKSPTSLKVTFEQLKRGESLNFDDAMQMEFNIAHQFLKTPDFYEGVRAAVIDKDQNPQWNPAVIDEVPTNQVTSFFSFKESL